MPLLRNGYTKEELKMLNESRKILGLPELKVTCTCVACACAPFPLGECDGPV